MKETVVIVGASHAGAQAAISLRQSKFDGEIIVIGEERELPYHRPPLSKEYMSDSKALGEMLIRPRSVYEINDIDLHLGVTAKSIDPVNKSVSTTNGKVYRYDKLILATGAQVRRLKIPGGDSARCFYLRTNRDVEAIKRAVRAGGKVVIIGGGYVGLEAAASLTRLGMRVTVIEAMERILQRVTAPLMSDFFRRVHAEEGVTIIESESVSEIKENKSGLTVTTNSARSFTADLVIIGIGVMPNTKLAEAAGLQVHDGVVVNEFTQTSDPNIYAIGDVTSHHNAIYDVRIRLESVPNATEQAKVAAAHICGTSKPYKALPWFWSDQFDLKLQIAGLTQGHDQVIIRGNHSTGRKFAAFYFRRDRFLGVDAVNAPQEFMFARMVLTKGLALNQYALGKLDANLKEAIVPSQA